MNPHENNTRLLDLKRDEVRSGRLNFGITDQKGRVIGYSFRIFAVSGTPISVAELDAIRDAGNWTPYWSYPEGWPSSFFEVRSSVTRDDKSYGATVVRGNYAKTLAEAEAILAKRIINARRSNTRKFAKETA